MRADEYLAAARRGQLHVVARLGQWIVLDGAESIGRAIGARVNAEHAGQLERRGLVDRDNARMRVRRAHHRRLRLPGKTEIVGEAALPGDEPRVLGARPRLPDEAEAGFRFIHGPTPVPLPMHIIPRTLKRSSRRCPRAVRVWPALPLFSPRPWIL